MDSRAEVDEETKHIKGEDECYGPFEDGSGVVFVSGVADAKGDCEHDFEEQEGEFYPEGDAEDGVFAEICFQERLY